MTLEGEKTSPNKNPSIVSEKFENFQKRYKELKQEFDKLGHREGENFIFNEGVVEKVKNKYSCINFMGDDYRKEGFDGKLYEVKLDDNREGYIYIGGTDYGKPKKKSGKCFILKSNGEIFEGSNYFEGGKGVLYYPDKNHDIIKIYSGNISCAKPITLNQVGDYSDEFGTYYYHWGEITYKCMFPLDDIFLDLTEEQKVPLETLGTGGILDKIKEIIANLLNLDDRQRCLDIRDFSNRWPILEIIIKEIGKGIEHIFSSRDVEIKFYEEDNYYVFETYNGEELRVPKENCKCKIETIADFINSAISLSKGYIAFKADEKEEKGEFKAEENTLLFSTERKDIIALRNVEEKLGLNTVELAERLNKYIREDKIKHPTIKYYEKDYDDVNYYVFETCKGKEFRVSVKDCGRYIRDIAESINRAIRLSKEEGFIAFKSDGTNLLASTKCKDEYMDIMVIKDVKRKLRLDVDELANRLNDYISDDKDKE